MNEYPSLSVVIPAAGTGSRMQSKTPKQYLTVAGKTILEHTIDAFAHHPAITRIVVCLSQNDQGFQALNIQSPIPVLRVEGGRDRAQSVLNGLRYLKELDPSCLVLVHDAARPALSKNALSRLIDKGIKSKSAILALPVIDTVKQARKSEVQEGSGEIKQIAHTLDRETLWLAQTPQMFELLALENALQAALTRGLDITDEASAMEHAGKSIQLVMGEARNFKVTRKEDLALAEFYLMQGETT